MMIGILRSGIDFAEEFCLIISNCLMISILESVSNSSAKMEKQVGFNGDTRAQMEVRTKALSRGQLRGESRASGGHRGARIAATVDYVLAVDQLRDRRHEVDGTRNGDVLADVGRSERVVGVRKLDRAGANRRSYQEAAIRSASKVADVQKHSLSYIRTCFPTWRNHAPRRRSSLW
jgi:hypothetical protein